MRYAVYRNSNSQLEIINSKQQQFTVGSIIKPLIASFLAIGYLLIRLSIN